MRLMLLNFLWVGLAGAVGSMARFGVGLLFPATARPIGTLLINITGSLFLGWFLTAMGDRVSEPMRLAIAVGFVGAYTTFSTYMFESDKMMQDGQWWRASAYVVGSVALGLVAVHAGVLLGRRT